MDMDKYSGLYIKKTSLTNGKDSYQHETLNKSCIWWHSSQQWWVGNCNLNDGYAYLDPYKSCPNDGQSGDWRRHGSDEIIHGHILYSCKVNLPNN